MGALGEVILESVTKVVESFLSGCHETGFGGRDTENRKYLCTCACTQTRTLHNPKREKEAAPVEWGWGLFPYGTQDSDGTHDFEPSTGM